MPTTPAAIAVDAGGSTTRALVVTRDGTCGPVARSGRGNPVSDPQRAASNIAEACAAAQAAIPHQPHVVLAAVAGSLSRDFPELSQELHSRELPTNVTIVSDLLAAYFSATAAQAVFVMIVGTGAVAARIFDGELAAIRDGLGWMLGDDGSGFWIGRRVARAVAAELDRRGPETSLTPRLLELLADTPVRTGVRGRELTALLTWSQSRSPVQMAELATLAAAEADHDNVAGAICSEAATRALRTLASLHGTETGPVIFGGGVLDPSGPWADACTRRWAIGRGRCGRGRAHGCPAVGRHSR